MADLAAFLPLRTRPKGRRQPADEFIRRSSGVCYARDMTTEPTVEADYPAGKVLLAILCLAFVFVLPAWWLAPVASGAASQLGDMSDATIVEIRAADGSVVMSGELRNHVDSLGNVEKDAALLGAKGERVIGEIEIEIPRKDAADQRQELEVDIISLEPRSTYSVIVNDRPVAVFVTDDRGSVDAEFHSVVSSPR
jgi:hypothetical protein